MKTKRKLQAVFCCALALLCVFSAAGQTYVAHAKSPGLLYALPYEPVFPAGDADGSGSVDAADARTALRCAAGLEAPLTYHAGYVADLDKDRHVTAGDARAILRISVGLDAPPTAETAARIPDIYDRCHIRISSGAVYNKLGALEPLAVSGDFTNAYTAKHLPLWRLTNERERDCWIDAFAEYIASARGMSDYDADATAAYLRRYTADFFQWQDLFICLKTESSGSYTQAITPPVEENGAFTFKVCTAYIEGHPVTCDIAAWLLFIPIKKASSGNYPAYICENGADLPLKSFDSHFITTAT